MNTIMELVDVRIKHNKTIDKDTSTTSHAVTIIKIEFKEFHITYVFFPAGKASKYCSCLSKVLYRGLPQ